jgi:hypothetical protein
MQVHWLQARPVRYRHHNLHTYLYFSSVIPVSFRLQFTVPCFRGLELVLLQSAQIAFGVVDRNIGVDILQWSLPRVWLYSHMDGTLLPSASASGANDAESGAFDCLHEIHKVVCERRVSGSGMQIWGMPF